LDKLNPDERVANRNLTADHVIAAANRILHPHSLDVKEVVWWSVYEIGHRLSDRFDDLPPNAGTGTGPLPRVFTAGDACHTHSPKAGQGMNVSMGDAFNLGWKLAQVLRGRARPSLLHSYAKERRAEAQRLIDTDQAWSRLMSAPPGESKLDGGDMPRVQQQFIANGEFTAGLAVRYAPSPLVGPDSHQALAAGLILGKRFHSAPVVRLADAMEMQLGHVAEADGRFRLYAFAGAGDSGQPDGAVAALCDWLERDAAAPLRRYGRPGEAPDALIDLRAVFQPPFPQLEITAMPPLLVPAKGRYGLVDLEKVFCVDPRPGRDIYALRGIDRARGCLVVVRPDQYVGHVLPLDARAELAEYFDGLLLAG
jgi:phenol 2-monooxygenase